MRYAAVIFVLLCSAVYAAAQENTEVQGFYQGYGKFSWKTGSADLDFPATKLTGGGFGIAYNLAPWFAMWTQIGFNGRVDSASMSFTISSLFANLHTCVLCNPTSFAMLLWLFPRASS